MAAKKEEKQEKPVTRFTRGQLLKLSKYKTLPAEVALKEGTLYSFEEADAAIDKVLKQKG